MIIATFLITLALIYMFGSWTKVLLKIEHLVIICFGSVLHLFISVCICHSILAPYINQTLKLVLNKQSIECNYDYLYIFDGGSYSSPLLASLSGFDTPQYLLSSSFQVFTLYYIFTFLSSSLAFQM